MVPRPLAMEMCVLARPVSAERFEALGVVTCACPTDAVMSEAQRLADAIAAGPRTAQGRIRAMVAQAYDQPEAQQLVIERDAMARAIGGQEAAEGIAAFLEKRTPRYGSS